MSNRKLGLALLVFAAASCGKAPPADPSKPNAYAIQLPLEPAPGGALQRLTLPADVLVAVRRADLGDIRVFDGRGKIVPIALVEDGSAVPQHRTVVKVYPVSGPASALGRPGLSIRIEDKNVARVVTLDASSPPTSRTAPSTAVLLDTHGLREPVQAIALDMDIPAGKPVALTLLSSADLKNWESLAEKILFRPADGSVLLGGATVTLPGVDLSDRFVSIDWGDASGVVVRSASVVTASIAPPARSGVATTTAPLADAYELRFDLPDVARLAAIRVTQAESDGVLPVKLFGRGQAEDPWRLLSATTLRAGDGPNLLDLSGPRMTSYRLVADGRTAGFSAPPRLELLFDPVELLVGLNGKPPFRLAAGLAAAPANYLSLAEMAPRESPRLADLPQATLAVGNGPRPIVTLQAERPGGALDTRKLLLWSALLVGVLVLAFAALRLARATLERPLDQAGKERSHEGVIKTLDEGPLTE